MVQGSAELYNKAESDPPRLSALPERADPDATFPEAELGIARATNSY